MKALRVLVFIGIGLLLCLTACEEEAEPTPTVTILAPEPTNAAMEETTTVSSTPDVASAEPTDEPTELPSPTIDESKIKIKACSLLSKSEAEALLNEPVQEPRTRPLQNALALGSACSYLAQESPLAVVVTLYQPLTSESDPVTLYNTIKEQATQRGRMQGVSGVGDEAFWDQSNLFVRKGKLVFAVRVGVPEGPDLPKMKTAAQQVSARLP